VFIFIDNSLSVNITMQQKNILNGTFQRLNLYIVIPWSFTCIVRCWWKW